MRKILIMAILVLMPVVAQAADTVVILNYTEFDPDSIVIKSGDEVTFSNKDDVLHDLEIIYPDKEIDDKGAQKPGEDMKIKFSKPGSYDIRCTIHSKMTMHVEVQ
jgi:plastocyanin